jgi:hypothetical protein
VYVALSCLTMMWSFLSGLWAFAYMMMMIMLNCIHV